MALNRSNVSVAKGIANLRVSGHLKGSLEAARGLSGDVNRVVVRWWLGSQVANSYQRGICPSHFKGTGDSTG